MGQERTHHGIAQQSASTLVHQPFRALKQIAVRRVQAPPAVRQPRPAPAPAAPDSESLFLDAVTDVTPLHARERERVDGPAPATPGRAVTHPDAEALAELCDLVAGSAPFDFTDGDEYVEGAVVGLDPRLLRRLRGGEFACQAHLDLHGMTSEEARVAAAAFLMHASQSGKRCVLIIHGRGRNSKDQIPVLKSRLSSWLARGQSARLVLAFTSARPCDGGVGAVYVLLRRHRHSQRRPIRVTPGAKR